MRTQPDQLKRVKIGFAVDQHQVRAKVAVTVIVPYALKGMILHTDWKREITSEESYGFLEESWQHIWMNPS